MGKRIYICTVGTGTAGCKSNVAEGIIFAVRGNSPSKCILLPSSSNDSIDVAAIVSEGAADVCEFETIPLTNHDDINLCRREILSVIKRFKNESNSVSVNPTSGSKQMSAAAVLAAIDAEVGEMEFIAGDRKDGVVMTGQERIHKVDALAFIAAVTAGNAAALMECGSYDGAVRLLEEVKEKFPISYGLARSLRAWSRFEYALAKREMDKLPSDFFEGLSKCRKVLMELTASKTISLERVADMLNLAGKFLSQGHAEETLAVAYRCAENLGKLQLRDSHGISERDGSSKAIAAGFKLDGKLASRMDAVRDNESGMGLTLVYDLLTARPPGTRSAICDSLRVERSTWQAIQKRNQTRYGHGTEPAVAEEVAGLLLKIGSAAAVDWPCLTALRIDYAYPKISDITKKEIENA